MERQNLEKMRPKQNRGQSAIGKFQIAPAARGGSRRASISKRRRHLATSSVCATLAVGKILGGVSTAHADDWTNLSGGSWSTASNWSYGVPDSATDIGFTTNGQYTVTLDGPSFANNVGVAQTVNVTLGLGNNTLSALALQIATSDASITLDGTGDGQFKSTGSDYIGYGKLLIQSAAQLSDSGASIVYGAVTVSGAGSMWRTKAEDGISMGELIEGAYLSVQSGGEVDSGFVNVNTGGINVIGSGSKLKIAGVATVGGSYISVFGGGQLSTSSGSITGGNVVSSTDDEESTGGSLTVSDPNSSWTNTGNFSISTPYGAAMGSALNVRNSALVTVAGTTTVAAGSVINLSGGTLRTKGLDLGADSSRLNFTGGTLQLGGGASNLRALSLASGCTLAGTGAIAGTVTGNGGIISPGNASTPIGALSMTGLTLSGGSLAFDLGSGRTSDLLQVTGSGGLNLASATNLNLNNIGTLTPGTYTLIDYTGGFSGSLSNLQIANTFSGYNFSLTNTGSAIDLIVASAAAGTEPTGSSGSWQSGSAWNGNSPPSSSSNVSLDSASTYTLTVGSGSTAHDLTVSAGNVTVDASNGSLQLSNNINVTGGTLNTGSATLRAGQTPGIGEIGAGNAINVSGGTLNTSTLDVDDANGLNVTGAGKIVTAALNVGITGSASASQSGGSVQTAGDFTLGRYDGGNGSYTLSGGTLAVGGSEYVGQAFSTVNGSGTFTQTGGVHTVTNQLSVGNQTVGTGTYAMKGGTLQVTNGVTVGEVGTFVQTGGTVDLQNGGGFGDLNVVGSYYLSSADGPAVLNVGHTEYIGSPQGGPNTSNASGTFIQDGGTHTITGNLTLARYAGTHATYILNGGSLQALNLYVAGDAGSGIPANDSDITSGAEIIINGGTASIGRLIDGSQAGGVVHIWDKGTFTINPAGTLITDSLINDGTIYNNGGALTYNGVMTGHGQVFNAAGTLTWESGSTINTQDVTIAGGTAVSAGNVLIGSGSGSVGILNITGGATTINGTLGAGNDGTVSGGAGNGQINVSGGTLYASTVLLGDPNGGSGHLIISGSAHVTVGGGLTTNDLTMNGGSLTVLDSDPPANEDSVLNRSIVGGYMHDGAMYMNDGTVSTPYLKVGIDHVGTYTQNGGTISITNQLIANQGTTASSLSPAAR